MPHLYFLGVALTNLLWSLVFLLCDPTAGCTVGRLNGYDTLQACQAELEAGPVIAGMQVRRDRIVYASCMRPGIAYSLRPQVQPLTWVKIVPRKYRPVS